MTPEPDQPLFSYPVKVRKLPARGVHETFEADAAIAAAVAAAFDLTEVKSLRADARIKPWQRQGVSVSGTVTAVVVQPCAISGEPLQASVSESFERLYVPEGSRLAAPNGADSKEWVLEVDGDEVPDTFQGDAIDLSEAWLETFSLGLDPFARLPDAELPDNPHEEPAPSPFAALSKLKLN
ncbi:MAG: DUF177 domain-containing protein [Ahrensia sp.]|nr:DUF177 domain-containing protein [Ahrensia sp.]